MSLAIIVAISENNCIGKNNKLPWNIPEDLDRFKKITLGHICLMGKNTLDSIIAYIKRPLPDRQTVVLSDDPSYIPPAGVIKYTSLEEALDALRDKTVFVCGGASVYRATLPLADKLYITRVHRAVDGDTFFPEIDFNVWKETEREDKGEYSFLVYEKK